jgi:toxin ParE1/3/4
MDVYKVKMANAAKSDISDIALYISSQLNASTAALNTVRAIRQGIDKLKANALFYPVVRDDRLAGMGYRSLTIKNYSVFYIANEKEKTVSVGRVLYGRRNWQSIL